MDKIVPRGGTAFLDLLEIAFSMPKGPDAYTRRQKGLWNKAFDYTTKKFYVDQNTTIKLCGLVADNLDLYEEQRAFAIPPFPDTYVEFDFGDHGRRGLLLIGKTAVLGVGFDPDSEYVPRLSKHYARIEEHGILVRPWDGAMVENEVSEPTAIIAGLSEILWILMHRPGTVSRIDHPDRKVIGREGFTRYRAHSVLTIDLAKKDIVKAIHQNGHRGSGVREHNVMGHWVHLHHDRRCTHVWERRERPEGQPARYDCHLCGTSRVWRKDFVRGDASLGKKMHTYEVTDSRLKKVGHAPLKHDQK